MRVVVFAVVAAIGCGGTRREPAASDQAAAAPDSPRLHRSIRAPDLAPRDTDAEPPASSVKQWDAEAEEHEHYRIVPDPRTGAVRVFGADAMLVEGMVGFEAGEMTGGFGFGDIPRCSGGGGVGLGTYGNMGHGTATGGGYGAGGRRGDRGRAARVPEVKVGQPSGSGDIDKAIVRRYVRRNLSKIKYCYEKELIAAPDLRGTVTTHFYVGADGKVRDATAEGVSPEVASCVANVIESIQFPKPKGGAGVNLIYPFTFVPTGG